MKAARAAIVLALACACVQQAGACSSQLYASIEERLGYMQEVALHKALNGLPIEDLQQEERVLAGAVAAASAAGLDPDAAADFFRAQISAAKAIQYRYRADLLALPPQPRPRDLTTEIRPALLALGDRIISQLANCAKQRGSHGKATFEQLSAAVAVRYLSEADKRLLHAALAKLAE